jgi:hypothetical protein
LYLVFPSLTTGVGGLFGAAKSSKIITEVPSSANNQSSGRRNIGGKRCNQPARSEAKGFAVGVVR